MPQARWHALLVVAVTLLVYCPAVMNEFVMWDDNAIFQNARYNPATVQKIGWYWYHTEDWEYLPLTRTLWGALAPLARVSVPGEMGATLNASIYHACSLCVHAGAALAAYWLLLQIVGRPWPATAGALLFALHPVQVESVAWASGLKDVLFGCFAILATACYVRWTRTRERGGWAAIFYLLGIVCLLASIFSKSTGVVTTGVAVLVGWQACRRPLKTVLVELSPWLAISICFGALARYWMPTYAGVPLWQRPFVMGDAAAFYLYKLLWPAWLAVDYGRIPGVVMSHGWGYAIWVAPVALAAILWRIRREHRLLAVGGLLTLGTALPTLGITPHLFQIYSTTADHYLYLPMLGVALAGAAICMRMPARTGALVAAVVLTALGLRSAMQTSHWQNNHDFWRHALAVNRQSFAAHTALADIALAAGQRQEARRLLLEAFAINPDFYQANQRLTVMDFAAGDLDGATDHFYRAMKIVEGWPPGHQMDLGAQYEEFGRAMMQANRPGQAVRAYQASLRHRPGHASTLAALKKAMAAAATRPASTDPAGK